LLDYLEFPYLLNLKKHNIQIISGLDDINEECSKRNDKRLVQMKSQMQEQSHSMDRGRSVPRGQKQPSKHAVSAAMARNPETGSSIRSRNPAGKGNARARNPGTSAGSEPQKLSKTPVAKKPEIKQEKQSPIIEPPKPKKKKVEKKLPEEESEKEEGECTDDSDE
jgi:hypothetical protein